jgi:hypothetical protein
VVAAKINREHPRRFISLPSKLFAKITVCQSHGRFAAAKNKLRLINLDRISATIIIRGKLNVLFILDSRGELAKMADRPAQFYGRRGSFAAD